MISQAQALFHLQEIDLLLIKHKKRLAEIATALQGAEGIRDAQQALERVQATLKPLKTQQRDLELQAQSTEAKRKTTEQRLYSGSVKNPKELQEMQQEIAALQKRTYELEEHLLDVLGQVESTEATLQQAEATLALAQSEQATRLSTLSDEQSQLQAELKLLEQRRAKALEAISPASLQAYNALRPSKANQPCALITADRCCGVCGIEFTSALYQAAKKGDELVTCNNCRRILVYMG